MENIKKIKALLKKAPSLREFYNRGSFFYGGVRIGSSPDGVKLWISLIKRDNPSITLYEVVEKKRIKTKQSIEMAIEFWDKIEPMPDIQFAKMKIEYEFMDEFLES